MKIKKAERGASLLDVILAIGIMGIAAPFLYGKITESAKEIREIAYASHLTKLGNAVANYIALNESLWPEEYEHIIPPEDFFDTLSPFGAMESKNLPPPMLAVFKTTSTANVRTTNAYLIADIQDSTIMFAHKFAQMLGPNGGVSEEDGFIYSGTGQWSAKIPGVPPGKIVVRLTDFGTDTDRSTILHRVRIADAEELNSMETDLGMSDAGIRRSILNINNLDGVGLDSEDATAAHLDASSFATNSILFQQGLRLTPNDAAINILRVSGDALGFRKITAKGLFGGMPGKSLSAASEATHSNQGRIIADRTNIFEELQVGNNLTVKPGSARSISAFTEVSAQSLSAPQMTAGHIYIAGNSGITVSSDKLSDSSNPPLKLGGWSFPNSGGALPEFRTLRIMSWSSDLVADILTRDKKPMTVIMSKNWMEAEAKK